MIPPEMCYLGWQESAAARATGRARCSGLSGPIRQTPAPG